MVERGKSSSSALGQALPSAPQKFNHQALVAKLQKISPEIARDVNAKHQNRVKARKAAKMKKAAKKEFTPEKPKRKSRPRIHK
jgi:hypothetical protein